MRNFSIILFASLFVLLSAGQAHAGDEQFDFGNFGLVYLFASQPNPQDLIIFISGDGGDDRAALRIAKTLTQTGSYVALVDVGRFERRMQNSKSACIYPAGDLEELAKYVEKRKGFSQYRAPVIVGHSSGASLVYIAMAQGPVGTFRGGFSLGFEPDYSTLKLPCKQNLLKYEKFSRTVNKKPDKGALLKPADHLGNPWIVLQGSDDKLCTEETIRNFTTPIKDSELMVLTGVGHGFAGIERWYPQLAQAYKRIVEPPLVQAAATTSVAAQKLADEPTQSAKAAPADISDLPTIELRSADDHSDTFVFLVSGDGGWAGIDKDLGKYLSQGKFPVAGFDSLKYFWSRKTAEQTSGDISRAIEHYLSAWNKKKVVLVGYSFGADIIIAIAEHLSPALRNKVELASLLAPDFDVDYEIHVADWVGVGSNRSVNLRTEAGKLSPLPSLCIYGKEESESLCKEQTKSFTKVLAMNGGHHFNGDYEKISDAIIAALKDKAEK